MNWIDLTKNSFKVFKANRKRTFLTMLGIVIGISAVIVIMSVGAGAQSLILDQITSIGADLVSVTPGYSDESGPPASLYGIQVTTLKKSDADALEKISELKIVASYVQSMGTVQYENQSIETNFMGVTASYADVESIKIEQGSYFEKSDEEGVSRVVVLGWQIWQDLFNGQDPIGQKIKIKKESFRVIGVIEKRGTQGFQNQDNLVFVPLGAAQKVLLGINHLHGISAKVNSQKDIEYTIQQTKDILRERHDIDDKTQDDFSVRSTAQALDILTTITNALRFFLAGIAAISLIVGGVGIMNIMLVSVNERTREIGLRKAVGATTNNVQFQFLIESVALTVLGGIVGIILGAGFSGLVAVVANYLGYNWAFIVTMPSIILGVGVSGFVGILFGWYPARKAARLEPVEALHYE